MSQTFHAILRGDRLEWTGDAPSALSPDRAIPVTVVVEESAGSPIDADDDGERWRLAVEALRRIAARDPFAGIGDPVEWQREIRTDRPLPGRES